LDDVFFVALGNGAGWRVREGNTDFLGNGELGVLRTFLRTRALLARAEGRPGCRLFKAAGRDLRPRLLTLEDGDLVAELPHGLFESANPILLRMDYGEQRFDQRCALLRWNVREWRESIRHTS
jgi:hypothetical protein